MRLDKFLKTSRLIKRRTVANEVCDAGKVQINGRLAKAGNTVQVGDVLRIAFAGRLLTVEIMQVAENVRSEQAKEMYKVLKEERIREDLGENALG